ncbi:hypothetical protein [Allorhizobium ampelinum]|uniref:hypothetical protein n=1 Tax=Allorhizobium ampelinum TaxID=3025782 RepID=UPI000B3FADED|nr:hypothetical protein [Allorhizobium ampelinum]NTA27372.1 hypothetical protein [Allorhizobium ampelinum]OVE94427.1 hypothetical protein B7W85_12820 [Allorhizobium ampelinum]
MATIEETKRMIEVMQAFVDGKEVEIEYSKASWLRQPDPLWRWDSCEYRIRETPDTIDWSHVDPSLKWMARDGSGAVYLYDEKPITGSSVFVARGKESCRINGIFSSYRRGTVDWKDSLVERPEGV